MAQNALQATKPAPVAEIWDEGIFSDSRLELIRRQSANGAPEDLFLAMIEIARVRGLDPLAKQISLINFGNQWQITTTIDGYRAIAESTGSYAGSDAPMFEVGDRKTTKNAPIPESCSVTVYKLVGGQRYPFTATVYWDEYTGNNHTWNKMPRTMLAKVAESHALRKAFPKVMSGLYTTDEMDQAVETTGTVVDRATGEIAPPTPRRDTRPQAPRAVPQRPVASSEDGPPINGNKDGRWNFINKKVHAFLPAIGWTHEDLHAHIATNYQVESVNNLDTEQYDRIQKWLEATHRDDPSVLTDLARDYRKGAASEDEYIEATPTSLSIDIDDAPDAARFR